MSNKSIPWEMEMFKKNTLKFENELKEAEKHIKLLKIFSLIIGGIFMIGWGFFLEHVFDWAFINIVSIILVSVVIYIVSILLFNLSNACDDNIKKITNFSYSMFNTFHKDEYISWEREVKNEGFIHNFENYNGLVINGKRLTKRRFKQLHRKGEIKTCCYETYFINEKPRWTSCYFKITK